MSLAEADNVEHWLRELETRALEKLTFAELTRSVRALSMRYVQKRDRLGAAEVFGGEGKRAAFSSYFGPLHYFTIERVVAALDLAGVERRHVLDLGCGTGVGGAAYALAAGRHAEVFAYDIHPWAVHETRWTLATLGVKGQARCRDFTQAVSGGANTAIVAAYAVNELDEVKRNGLLPRLARAASEGAAVLVVEPIAHTLVSWWGEWARTFASWGGVAREWRFPIELPAWLKKLDRASGLRHDVLTCRTLSSR